MKANFLILSFVMAFTLSEARIANVGGGKNQEKEKIISEEEFIQVQENFASKLNIISDLIEDIENLADEMNMTETVENNNSTNDPNVTIATQMEESNLNVTDVIENITGESNTTITSNFEESKLNGTDNVEANMTESIMMKAMKGMNFFDFVQNFRSNICTLKNHNFLRYPWKSR